MGGVEFKNIICTFLGAVGGTISSFLGGWDTAFATLLIFMCIDFLSGLMVAGIFKKSRKTETGALESRVGWKGLCRKGMTLLFVLIGHRMDLAIGSNYIRDALIIGFVLNELISIIENAGLMGIPLPKVIRTSMDVLTDKIDPEP